ncbi:MAG: hypothetical protein Q4F93_06890 [bacterium]|nr:hypothetical protein [bacterium]
MKSTIATYSKRLMMSQDVGMIGRWKEGKMVSTCNPVINLQSPKAFIGQFFIKLIIATGI